MMNETPVRLLSVEMVGPGMLLSACCCWSFLDCSTDA